MYKEMKKRSRHLKREQVEISTLPLIKTPGEFFNADKVLLTELIKVDEVGPIESQAALKANPLTFEHKGELYTPISIKGSPLKMAPLLLKGVWFQLNETLNGGFMWRQDFTKLIKEDKAFDISRYYHLLMHMEVPFIIDNNILINRYLNHK